MDRETMLQFLDHFLDLGIIFEDSELMLVMKSHLERKYYDYELNELF